MRTILKVALAASLALAAAPAVAEPIAVIVNKDNPRSGLTVQEVRSMFLGRRTEWPDGTPAQPFDLPPAAPGRAVFIEAVAGMKPERFAEQWVDQQVRGAGNALKVAASPGAAVKLVAKFRGGIAFVPLSAVTSAVKVLILDGKLPGQRGYPIPEIR
jgi:ABC-type phosphate transport system substrate-binding protein